MHLFRPQHNSVFYSPTATRDKLEGRGFYSRWCHWIFSLTQSFRPHWGPGVDLASNRNEYQEHFLGGKGGRCVGLPTLPPSCVGCPEILGESTSWKPQGLSRPVMGLLYLFTFFISPPHCVGRDSILLLAGRSGDRIQVGKNIFPLHPELPWDPTHPTTQRVPCHSRG